jgi:hypothetical protein
MLHIEIKQGDALPTPEDRHDAMRILAEVAGSCGFNHTIYQDRN